MEFNQMASHEFAREAPSTMPRREGAMRTQFLIPCTIERGGFSTERIFTIRLPDGPETFAGYYEHFLDGDRNQLPVDVPGSGEVVEGFAKCRILQQQEDGTIIIDIPSSDSLLVHPDVLVEA
jgi:hypothetical protein